VVLQHVRARLERGAAARAVRSLEDFVARTGVNREELATLAEIGALNAFGHHRREALWQIERAVRPAGELFEGEGERREARGESLIPVLCPR